ncbi:MAG: endolytic transglycosylase MltG, partial [Nitrospira sp.]
MRRSLQRGLLAGLLAIGAVMAYLGALWLLGPVMSVATGASAPAPVVVEITDGMTLRHLAAKLERDRLIRSELAFVLLAKFTGADRHLKAGEYALHAGMRPRDILNEFLSGRGVLHQITIPEGYTIVEMAQVVAQKSL